MRTLFLFFFIQICFGEARGLEIHQPNYALRGTTKFLIDKGFQALAVPVKLKKNLSIKEKKKRTKKNCTFYMQTLKKTTYLVSSKLNKNHSYCFYDENITFYRGNYHWSLSVTKLRVKREQVVKILDQLK